MKKKERVKHSLLRLEYLTHFDFKSKLLMNITYTHNHNHYLPTIHIVNLHTDTVYYTQNSIPLYGRSE